VQNGKEKDDDIEPQANLNRSNVRNLGTS